MTTKSVIVASIVLLVALPLFAHHPFSAEFDPTKPVTLSGTVTKMDWANPHAYLHLNVMDADGKMQNWELEMGSLNALRKAGWTKLTLKPGDMVTVDGWLARSKLTTANMKSVRLPDGRELSAASSFGGESLTARRWK